MTTNQPTVCTIASDLNADTAPALLQAIFDACRAGGTGVVLNVVEAREVGPHGLGAIVRGLKVARDAGATLTIGRANPELTRMLALTGLDQVVAIAR